MPFSNSYEIYKRGDNGKRVVGVFPDARDCVDISVKLDFELKELQKQGAALTFDINILIRQAINSISNTDLRAPLLPALARFNVRDLQSSDYRTRQKASAVAGEFDKAVSYLDPNPDPATRKMHPTKINLVSEMKAAADLRVKLDKIFV